MSKIIGYKYIGIQDNIQQFEPIIEEEPISHSYPCVNTSWSEAVKSLNKDYPNEFKNILEDKFNQL